MTAIYMQWGERHLTRALFDQDTIWVTARSEVKCVKDMDLPHVLNTLLMLERMQNIPLDGPLQSTPLYQALYKRVADALAKPVAVNDTDPPTLGKRVADALGKRVAVNDTDPPTLGLASDEEVAEAVGTRGVRVGTTPMAIQELVQEASEHRRVIRMTYVDGVGNRTVREIIPTEVEERRVGLGFKEPYLVALDVAKGEPRTFKLARIERVQEV